MDGTNIAKQAGCAREKSESWGEATASENSEVRDNDRAHNIVEPRLPIDSGRVGYLEGCPAGALASFMARAKGASIADQVPARSRNGNLLPPERESADAKASAPQPHDAGSRAVASATASPDVPPSARGRRRDTDGGARR